MGVLFSFLSICCEMFVIIMLFIPHSLSSLSLSLRHCSVMIITCLQLPEPLNTFLAPLFHLAHYLSCVRKRLLNIKALTEQTDLSTHPSQSLVPLTHTCPSLISFILIVFISFT